MEPHRLGLRKTAGERAEPRKGRRRPVLVVEPDGRRSQGLGVVRSGPDRSEKFAFRGDGAQDLLVRGAAQQMGLDDVRDAGEARDERWQARGAARMTEILRADGRRGIGLDTLRVLPGARRVGLLTGKREREAELEPDERALWIAGREDPQPAGGACRPGLQRLAHLLDHLRPGGRVRSKRRRFARLPLDVAPRRERDADHGSGSGRGGEPDDDPHSHSRAHRNRR